MARAPSGGRRVLARSVRMRCRVGSARQRCRNTAVQRVELSVCSMNWHMVGGVSCLSGDKGGGAVVNGRRRVHEAHRAP